ncbi:hypothetical protein Pla123a_04700 [Posidoniimonas polymericola]|uniref:Uncharacterized protein n=1 Tax=Posidoniimonas polymericola TaxID=2528002 RepID=A0A5C5ZGH8_9BACT|nr:tetratricopeptide repeat protein [Posidoniimonas polymericola]TWT85663.1 hypothetical protein Pla123a_04700 [Posidoniimonas polymericola]
MRTNLVLYAVIGAVTLCAIGPADAQRTRFPGDSPTRPAVMDGKVLGTPSHKYPNVPTFSIPQGGYGPYSGGYGGWGSYYRRSGGWNSGYYPGYYSTPGYYSGYYSGYYPYYAPVQVVDYREIYGLRPAEAPAAALPRRAAGGIAGAALAAGPDVIDGPSPDQLKHAWRYIDLGDRYLREGRLLDARNRYRKAEKQAPDLPELAFRTMLLELATGRYAEAVEALERGLEQQPDWPDSRFDLGTVYSKEGLADVHTALQERLQQFPNDADARLLAGVLLHFGGERRAAELQLQKAMQLTQGAGVAGRFLAEDPVQPPPVPGAE